MGGCITPTQAKKPKPLKRQQTGSRIALQQSQNTSAQNLKNFQSKQFSSQNNNMQPQPQKPKFKKITGQQFTRFYRIEDNVGSTSRAEGPKYVSNYADGLGRVLRVVPFGMGGSMMAMSGAKEVDIEKRVRVYAEILGLQVFEDQESNMILLQDYYCGPYLHELTNPSPQQPQFNQQQIRRHLSQIHQIIQAFHQKNVVIGNLSVFSFMQTSQFDSTVRMIELNLMGVFEEGMGHAFKAQKSMDWEAFAFIVQSVVTQSPPIFIPHKLQYIQNSNNTIHTLLKGKKIKRQQLDTLGYNGGTYANNLISNPDLILGYKFRSDLNRLIRQRKRRNHHRNIYYSEDYFNQGEKLSDEAISRMEANKIFERIDGYIKLLNPQCQQSFLMFSSSVNNQTLKKLKTVFLAGPQNDRMNQFKETLPLIK